MIFGMGAKKRLISEQYFILFASFQSARLSYSLTFVFHLRIHTEPDLMVVLLLLSCQFLWRFCCICSLNSCAFVPSCLLFSFSLSLPRSLPCSCDDIKMNLCNVYLLFQHLYISTCMYYKSVGIIGTWQVVGEFLFDLILRNIHFKKLMCVFICYCCSCILLLFFLVYTYWASNTFYSLTLQTLSHKSIKAKKRRMKNKIGV